MIAAMRRKRFWILAGVIVLFFITFFTTVEKTDIVIKKSTFLLGGIKLRRDDVTLVELLLKMLKVKTASVKSWKNGTATHSSARTTDDRIRRPSIDGHPQKCRVPILDPFHREARPYITYRWTEKCHIKQHNTKVLQDGSLVVRTKGWDRISVTFIRGVSDSYYSQETIVIYRRKRTGSKIDDGSLKLAMKTDFVKVEFERHGETFSEWQAYPMKQPPPKSDPPFQMYSEKKDKFNVLMIMLDSFSHASGQRYLPKTYRFLQDNPNSVIIKGHTIVGDATTPQLSAMFFGAQPEELKPEGRRGYAGSQHIDAWPSIFKSFKINGYATLFSEDDGSVGTFTFRLKGFAKQPTFKYLRPWWQATRDLLELNQSRAASCPAVFSHAYLKDFYREYPRELSLSVLINSGITHGTPEKAFSLDEEFAKLFQHLKTTRKLDSTIVVIFGDHGTRTKFRETKQGKLEHRLPLMTMTFPPRFHKEFPEEMKTIKRNAHVLTTPYDMHVTLKHLLAITETPPKHQFGRSLFTDIVKLNRTCKDTGVPQMWCVCTKFEPVEMGNQVIHTAALQMVETINTLISEISLAKTRCQVLKLDRIVKSSKAVHGIKGENGGARDFDTYEITFTVSPSGGLFEGTAEHNKKTNGMKISRTFARTNLYGDQPKCIANLYPYLRQFCYCKVQ